MRNSNPNISRCILTTFAIVLWAISLTARSATIEVTAQIGESGCDLVEAINAANNDTPTGGCIANSGSFGDDLIVLNFTVPISEFIVSSVDNTNEVTGANGLPVIFTNIRIVGRGSEKVVIKRSDAAGTPEFRLFNISNGRLSLRNLSIQNGNSFSNIGNGGSGGAILLNGNELIVSNCEFIGNKAGSAGAISIGPNGEAMISNSLFSGNQSDGSFAAHGGAFRVSGKLTSADSEFTNNFSKEGGGAVYSSPGSETVIRRSLLANNGSGGEGGAISVTSRAAVSIYDSTISDNAVISPFEGGGIAATGSEMILTVTNSTISGNSADQGAGINFSTFIGSDNSSLNVVNSIVSGNDALLLGGTNEIRFNSRADTFNLNHSLVGHAGLTSSLAIRGDFDGENNIFATSDGDTPTALNNILLPLALNEGSTRTHALPPNSPAINNATDGMNVQAFVFSLYAPGCRGTEIGPSTPLPAFRPDQRGVERPSGAACDIGAYEFAETDEVREDDPCYVIKAANQSVVSFCL